MTTDSIKSLAIAEWERNLNARVRGDLHGIRNGWFQWPWNFDPTWLVSCDGFEAKETEHVDAA